MEYGASIERGVIQVNHVDGYIVVSLDREGIVSPPLSPADDTSYNVGDIVYFFLFRDGTGKILFKV